MPVFATSVIFGVFAVPAISGMYHWNLPAGQYLSQRWARINFKILTYMFNCSVGNAPEYLTELLTCKVAKRTLRSSESSVGCYEVPYNKKKTFSDICFSTVGPMLWNTLPLELKQSESVDSFKKHLKSYFFKDFFQLF